MYYCNISFTIVSSSLVLYSVFTSWLSWRTTGFVPHYKSVTLLYQTIITFPTISVHLSLTWEKRQSPLSHNDRCMLLPWTPHQGPDKRRANNNLWAEAPPRSRDQTLPSLYLMFPCNQRFFSNTDPKAAECLTKTFISSILEQNRNPFK